MPQEESSRIQPDAREFEVTQASSTNDSPLPFAMQDGRTIANCPPATGHFPPVNPSNLRPDCALQIPTASNASGDNRKIHFVLFGSNDSVQMENHQPSNFFLERASLIAFRSRAIRRPSSFGARINLRTLADIAIRQYACLLQRARISSYATFMASHSGQAGYSTTKKQYGPMTHVSVRFDIHERASSPFQHPSVSIS